MMPKNKVRQVTEMKGIKMPRVALFVLLVMFLTFPALGQDRVEMTSPVIRTTVEDIILSVDLTDFLGRGTPTGSDSAPRKARSRPGCN